MLKPSLNSKMDKRKSIPTLIPMEKHALSMLVEHTQLAKKLTVIMATIIQFA